MKKIILLIGTVTFFILCSCNEDASANKNNKQDASNTSMDEIGTARDHEGDKQEDPRHSNLNDGSKDSSAVITQTPGPNNH